MHEAKAVVKSQTIVKSTNNRRKSSVTTVAPGRHKKQSAVIANLLQTTNREQSSQDSVLQRKVKIGASDDYYEQEADNVADTVVAQHQGNSEGNHSPLVSSVTPLVQRETDEAEEELQTQSFVQRQAEEEEEELQTQSLIQRQAEEEEEELQAKSFVQRQAEEEEEELQAKSLVQRQAEEEEEELQTQSLVQRQAEEEEEELQTQSLVQRQAEEEEEQLQAQSLIQRQAEEEEEEFQTQSLVQRQAEEEEEQLQAQSLIQRQAEEEEEELQAKSNEFISNSSSQFSNQQRQQNKSSKNKRKLGSRKMLESAEHALHHRDSGAPMRRETRDKLEASLGVDLSQVRIHQGPSAEKANSDIRARAFTHKNHIWLGRGESQSDLHLMAHETTHVLQQQPEIRRKLISSHDSSRNNSVTNAAGGSVNGQNASSASAQSFSSASAQNSNSSSSGSSSMPVAPKEQATYSKSVDKSTGAISFTADTGNKVSVEEPQPAETPQGPSAEEVAAQRASVAAERSAAKAAAQKQVAQAEGARVDGVVARVGATATNQQGPAATPAARAAATTSAASNAQASAEAPENESSALGQASKVDNINNQEAGEVKQKTFVELVEEKLKEVELPATPEEMDNWDGDKASGIKDDLSKGVKQQTKGEGGAAAAITGAVTAEPVDAEQKPKMDLPERPEAPDIGELSAEQTAPLKRPDEVVSLEANRDEVENKLADNKLSKERLEKANDEKFTALQKSRETVNEHADKAPQTYREEEQKVLKQEEKNAADEVARDTEKMQKARGDSEKDIASDQDDTMTAEEKARKAISNKIESIYNEVEPRVQQKLDKLLGEGAKEGEEGEVDKMFTDGEKKARESFEDYISDSMSSWRWKRYGGRALIPVVGTAIAAGTWVYDKVRGIDDYPEIVQMFVDGKNKYLEQMRETIKAIGKHVDEALAWCKSEIKTAQEKIQKFIDEDLPADQKKVAEDAQREISGRFEDLSNKIDDTKNELADKVVQRYKDSVAALDARIEELQAENRGLVDQFTQWLGEVLEMLDNFRKRLGKILSDAGEVIEEILDDPIGFLGNLLKSVKQGFEMFSGNILKHLKNGIFGWLFGALATAGINLPSDFSIKSIVGLILEILGITVDRMKTKVERLIGPKNMALLEVVWEKVSILMKEGPAGLWEELKKDLSDLKQIVMDGIRDWIITKIVTAAVTKLVSMFNPAGAIVQAILTIYNVIMFFIERIEQIMQLVESVVGSLGRIVKGQIKQAATFVEKTMGLMVPLLISFLARLLGLGGIAGKISKIVKKVRKKVDRAIDKMLKKMKKKFKALFKKGKKGQKVSPKVKEERKQKALKKVKAQMQKGVRRGKLKSLLNKLKKQYDLKEASLNEKNDVKIVNSPGVVIKGEIRVSAPDAEGKHDKVETGGTKIGNYSAYATNATTVRGATSEYIDDFPFPSIPENALRPTKAVAEWMGKAGSINRTTGAGNSQKPVNKMGNVEAKLLGSSAQDYQGGHLIANEFGGRDSFDNMVPMRRGINTDGGVYRQIEDWVGTYFNELPATVRPHQPVNLKMEVKVAYKSGNIKMKVGDVAKALGGRLRGEYFASQNRQYKSQARPLADNRIRNSTNNINSQITAAQARFDAKVLEINQATTQLAAMPKMADLKKGTPERAAREQLNTDKTRLISERRVIEADLQRLRADLRRESSKTNRDNLVREEARTIRTANAARDTAEGDRLGQSVTAEKQNKKIKIPRRIPKSLKVAVTFNAEIDKATKKMTSQSKGAANSVSNTTNSRSVGKVNSDDALIILEGGKPKAAKGAPASGPATEKVKAKKVFTITE